MLIVVILQYPINYYYRHNEKPNATLYLAASFYLTIILIAVCVWEQIQFIK